MNGKSREGWATEGRFCWANAACQNPHTPFALSLSKGVRGSPVRRTHPSVLRQAQDERMGMRLQTNGRVWAQDERRSVYPSFDGLRTNGRGVGSGRTEGGGLGMNGKSGEGWATEGRFCWANAACRNPHAPFALSLSKGVRGTPIRRTHPSFDRLRTNEWGAIRPSTGSGRTEECPVHPSFDRLRTNG